jgi:hypothetical protein
MAQRQRSICLSHAADQHARGRHRVRHLIQINVTGKSGPGNVREACLHCAFGSRCQSGTAQAPAHPVIVDWARQRVDMCRSRHSVGGIRNDFPLVCSTRHAKRPGGIGIRSPVTLDVTCWTTAVAWYFVHQRCDLMSAVPAICTL